MVVKQKHKSLGESGKVVPARTKTVTIVLTNETFEKLSLICDNDHKGLVKVSALVGRLVEDVMRGTEVV